MNFCVLCWLSGNWLDYIQFLLWSVRPARWFLCFIPSLLVSDAPLLLILICMLYIYILEFCEINSGNHHLRPTITITVGVLIIFTILYNHHHQFRILIISEISVNTTYIKLYLMLCKKTFFLSIYYGISHKYCFGHFT